MKTAPPFCVGQRVEDTWWPMMCGVITRITRRSVWVRADYPRAIEPGFDLQNGVVRYDSQHARLYLRSIPA